jgi:hypothetical protein
MENERTEDKRRSLNQAEKGKVRWKDIEVGEAGK